MIKSTITAIVLLFTMITVSAQQREVPNIGDPRLKVELPDSKGQAIALSSLKGKVVLLDFWASWCRPCRHANKGLVKLYAKYQKAGFEIYSVSVDDNKSEWLKAVKKDGIKWLQVNEAGSFDAESARRWNIGALPTTFLINKKGDVVAFDLEGTELENAITKLLAE